MEVEQAMPVSRHNFYNVQGASMRKAPFLSPRLFTGFVPPPSLPNPPPSTKQPKMPQNTDTPFVEKLAITHVEEALGHGAVDSAKNASDAEHKAAFWSTFKTHRMAVFWSCVISLSIVMEGYDTILINNFWAYPTCESKHAL